MLLLLDAERADPDLLDLDAIECAKRAVLATLNGALTVDIEWAEYAAGVECTGSESFERSRLMESVSSSAGSPETSKAGNDGKEGSPVCSSILLQTREGVSSITFMA